MSTFNPPADIAQITLAKSSDVNAVKAATAIAFGLLPDENKLKRGTVNFAVDTGTTNSYVVAMDASITTYTDGLQVVFRPLTTNTGEATITLTGLGTKSIRLTDSSSISAGDISAGAVIDVRYSTATGFFHLTPNSAIYAHDAGVSASSALASKNAAATSATNAATSATSAAGSASSASTSATNAATSASSMTASVASCTASQSAAATSATNAATSASGASTSATTATTQAGIATTQATNASTSATNAAASASTASTQASNAATSASTASTQATAAGTSATNAASSATAASGSASTASTQATNAAASATSASGSASTATTQASNASTSASAASTSATNAASSATTATTQAGIATTQATNAAASATSASTSATNAANYAAALIGTSTTSTAIATGSKTFTTQASKQFNTGQFVIISSNANPANYMFGQVTSYSTTSLVVNVLAIGGSGTLTDWNISVSGAQGAKGDTGSSGSTTKTIVNTAVAYNVTATDLGKIINCTSGTFTVSLAAAASLGSGFTCTIWNTGTGAITIDPNAAETIDGFTTWVLRSGEGLAVVCTGTNWQTDDKKPMRGYAEYIGTIDAYQNISSGAYSTCIGTQNTTSGSYAISIGQAYGGAKTASGDGSLIVSNRTSTASGVYSVVIQADSSTSNYSTSIGANSSAQGSVTATGAGAMALGGSYASGTDSFAAAIKNNTSSYGATGANSVAIGWNAKAAGIASVAIGWANLASNEQDIAIGFNCTASGGAGSGHAIAIGTNATCLTDGIAMSYGTTTGVGGFSAGYHTFAAGQNSIALGSYAVSSQYGKYAFASTRFATDGDAQSGKIVLRAATTTTTAVVLTSNGGAASTTNQLILASGQAMTIQGTLIAKVTASGAMAGWNITGIVSNNAGTMAVSGLALTAIGTDSIGLGAAPTIAVDNTNKGVTITSGYKSATSIRWVATVNTSEVAY